LNQDPKLVASAVQAEHLIHAPPPLMVLGKADDVRITSLVPVGTVARL
jgi:hypothetical protein